jgi:NhaA family Na+:H+ antiporter
MIVPAGIFIAFNHGHAGYAGWGVPMATDIAFCMGLLSLIRGRVPHALVIFLTALAIFDDIGGIVVIALFYGTGVNMSYLVVAGVLTLALVHAGRRYVTSAWFYALVGAALWYAVHHAGIHATIAGMVLGLAIPARPRTAPSEVFEALARQLERWSALPSPRGIDPARVLHIERELERLGTPVERFLHVLHPIVAFLVLPLFALANSGIPLGDMNAAASSSRVTLGIAAGLILGKPLGIYCATMLAVRLGMGELPGGATRQQLFGVSVVGGIGFTVALFIASLAYASEPEFLKQAKIGILFASSLTALVGFVVLRSSRSLVRRAPFG